MELIKMTTLSEILDLIGKADNNELDIIMDTARARRQEIAMENSASARVGMKVTFRNLSPRYLNGLTGTIMAINSTGSKGTIKLDDESTKRLAFTKQNRFYVELGTPYTMEGVPLSACDLSDEA
jgi:hypothetical protein